MQQDRTNRRTCPYCGAELPEEASFCPFCARSVNQRQNVSPPSVRWRKALRRAIPVRFLLLGRGRAGTAQYLSTRPRVYDDNGTGEVIYTDEDGTYQILLGWLNTPYEPAPVITQIAERDADCTFPICLFIHHQDTGINAGEIFLQKVASVTAEFDTPDDPTAYISYGDPAYDDYAPDAALTSFTHFLGRENSARGTWTITMENGDVILLHQTLNVDLIETVNIYPEDAPMDTIEDLQALVDSMEDRVGYSDVVNLHLPAVTYEGDLSITGRPVNLYGNTEGEGRTVFTGTVQVNPEGNNNIVYLYDIDFVGDGDGVGISSARRTWPIGCRFTGWRTAILCHGTGRVSGGICLSGCQFTQNQTAVHYNSNGTGFFNTIWSNCAFLNNETDCCSRGSPRRSLWACPAAGLRATAPTSTTAAASLWTSPRRLFPRPCLNNANIPGRALLENMQLWSKTEICLNLRDRLIIWTVPFLSFVPKKRPFGARLLKSRRGGIKYYVLCTASSDKPRAGEFPRRASRQ